jgi:hypothetical protein
MNSTIIVGIIIIAMIIVPIWYLIHSQSTGKRKLEKELAALGKNGEINISEHESWGNKVIGLDRENEKAAFFVQGSPKNKILLADLKKFTKCYVEKNLLNTNNMSNAFIYSSVQVRFSPREKSGEELVFPLFVDHEDMTLSNELQIAEAWSEKLNVIMRKHL